MDKTQVTFDTRRLNDLLISEESCVTLQPSFKRILTISPLQLSNIKESVRELLQSRATTYDAELDGIILSHKNIKLFDSVQLGDYGNFTLECIADVYIFKPTVGCVLKGIVNKRGKDHLGCLVHSIFNVSIPRVEQNDSLKSWPGNKIGIGQEVTFTVTKLDFSGRLPYIRGELICTELDEECLEEVDSGIGNFESIEEYGSESYSEGKKKKKKKHKHKQNDNCDPTEGSCVDSEDVVDTTRNSKDEQGDENENANKKSKRKHSPENSESPLPRTKDKLSNLEGAGIEKFKTPTKVMENESSPKKKKMKKKKECFSPVQINESVETGVSDDLIHKLMENRLSEIGLQSPASTSMINESPRKKSLKKKKSIENIESTESIISDNLESAKAAVDLSVTEDDSSVRKKKNKDKRKSKKSLENDIILNDTSISVASPCKTSVDSLVLSNKPKKRKKDKNQLDTSNTGSPPAKKQRKCKRPDDELSEIQSALIAELLADIQ